MTSTVNLQYIQNRCVHVNTECTSCTLYSVYTIIEIDKKTLINIFIEIVYLLIYGYSARSKYKLIYGYSAGSIYLLIYGYSARSIYSLN